VDQDQHASSSSKVAARPPVKAAAAAGKRKRRRAKAAKNREEIESQRMTHIAVERNRRRQMNEYLAVLRSLMPPSYAQRVIFLFVFISILNLSNFKINAPSEDKSDQTHISKFTSVQHRFTFTPSWKTN
jgi:hypothetical protein